MKLKTILVEDEEPARELLKNFLADHEEIEVIGECADGFSGVKAINELKPDLVFLDIQMPKLSGFELLELIEINPLIIFTTAFDQYAIKAFEMSAVDYLLKPFTRERFTQAVKKTIDKFANKQNNHSAVHAVIKAIDEKPELLERIAVKTGSKIHVIPVDDVFFLEAEGDYVMIHTKDGKHLKEKTMKYFETHLNPARFVRIHRSYLVNVNEILRIELYDKENYSVLLKNTANLKVRSSGYKLIKQVLNV